MGGQFAGHSDMAEAIPPVGGYLELEGLVLGVKAIHGGSDPGGSGEQEKARFVVAQFQFLGAAHHPLGGHAPQFGLLDLEASRKLGPGQGDGHAVSRRKISRSANDGRGLVGADFYRANAQPVGLGMRFPAQDFAHHNLVERGAGIFLVLLHLDP